MSFWFYILVSDVPEMALEEIDFDMGKFILEEVNMIDYFSEGEVGVEILFWGDWENVQSLGGHFQRLMVGKAEMRVESLEVEYEHKSGVTTTGRGNVNEGRTGITKMGTWRRPKNELNYTNTVRPQSSSSERHIHEVCSG